MPDDDLPLTPGAAADEGPDGGALPAAAASPDGRAPDAAAGAAPDGGAAEEAGAESEAAGEHTHARRRRAPARTRQATSRRPHRPQRRADDARSTGPRLRILVVLVAILAVGALADRASGNPTPSTPFASNSSGAPSVVAPGDALSSSWFCAGATDEAKGQAPGRLVVTNTAASPVTGTATMVSSTGVRQVVPIKVPAESHISVAESVPGGAPWVGAIVDLQGGLASVEQGIGGPLGASSTPCATTGSSTWYFAAGETLVNADTELLLLNPYPTDSIVDLTFTTDQGVEQPGADQGLVVPAKGLLAVDVRSHLRRRTRIATTINVRTGRVVAWKAGLITPPAKGEATIGSPQAANAPDPAAPVGGASVTLGAPSAGTSWIWPEGDSGNGFNEQYSIYNPGSRTADVSLSIGLDSGTAQPFNLSVAPESVTTISSANEARIPAGVGHFAVLHSLNGEPVVAERTLTVGKPSALSGIGEIPGIRAQASEWLLGANAVPSTSQGYLVVDNPSSVPVQVSVAAVGGGHTTAIPKLVPFTIPANRRASILLNKDVAPQTALLVTGSSPIVVERDLYGIATAPGVSLSPGVPLSTGK